MSSTHGRKRRPLTGTLEQDLRALGMRDMEAPESLPHRWRHPLFPQVQAQLSMLNLPGDTRVVAALPGSPARVMEQDALVRVLKLRIVEASGGNTFMPRSADR